MQHYLCCEFWREQGSPLPSKQDICLGEVETQGQATDLNQARSLLGP